MSSYVIFVQQGTFLCGQYIRNRLKRSGIYHRKLGLKRITNVKLLGESLVNEVQQDLLAIGAELEKLQPKFYEKIGRQIGYGTFNSEQRIIEAINDVAREMFRNNECNWPKIVSLYAVAGGMAVDCVRQGKSEFLPAIQKGMGLVLEEDLAAWIQANGGWSALSMKYRPISKQTDWTIKVIVFIITAIILFVYLILMAIKFFFL